MIKKPCRRFLLLMAMLLMAVTLNTGPVPQVAKCAPGAANAQCGGVSLPVWTYYTDASKTVACGHFDVCTATQYGCQTEYRTSVRKPCCTP